MLSLSQTPTVKIDVPYFRPDLGDEELDEVASCLRSGWLTTGPKARRFEKEFAAAVCASHAVAVNSCTAALHLAVDALGLRQGDAVLVPTMTFAATAEVVRYQSAIPILVDCDPVTGNMDLADAALRVEQLNSLNLMADLPEDLSLVGMIPVHVGGVMMDMDAVKLFSARNNLWVVEDAAHAIPAAWRRTQDQEWQRCGQNTSRVTCFSFYANKTITTGEGGMAVTEEGELAERIRMMSLHGLSEDAWSRYSGSGSWDYRIVAPGYKYNITDIAAALGVCQLFKAEPMRKRRQQIARFYLESFRDIEHIDLPPDSANRIHSWHLFSIKLRLATLSIGRDQFIEELKRSGVGCSVHWRPLHLHPYYRETFGWRPEGFPVATELWKRLVSLPIFSAMRDDEVEHVVEVVRGICRRHAR